MANFNVTPWADLSTMPPRQIASLARDAAMRVGMAAYRVTATEAHREYWSEVSSSAVLTIEDRLEAVC